jgi:hypothetical protein
VETDAGTRFAKAIAAKDAAALHDVLDPKIDFRGLTPGRFWEATSAAELVDGIVFGKWFEDSDHIDGIEHIETDTVAGRHRVGYRYRVTNGDGSFLVEQQAYFDVVDDRISWLRVLCAGYRPTD